MDPHSWKPSIKDVRVKGGSIGLEKSVKSEQVEGELIDFRRPLLILLLNLM